MGWYLKKGFNFGPLRLNLSKSGLGYSFGVRGARIGTGPRGTYVHLGRGGVYYRKSLSSAGAHRTGNAQSFVPIAVGEPGTPVLTANAAQLHDGTSEGLLQEIQDKHRKTRWAPIGGVVGGVLLLGMSGMNLPVWAVIPLIPLVIVICVYLHRRDYEAKLVMLKYDLDADARTRYGELLKGFAALGGSARIWRIMNQNTRIARKYNAGAGKLVDKKPITVSLSTPAFMETDVGVWSIALGSQKLYFFPDRVLVYQGSEVGAVSYAGLRVAMHQVRYIESDHVPSDSQVIDRTWQYVNKNGAPDRRFSNNRQFPVVLYAEIIVCSESGLNLLLQSSDPNKATTFVAAMNSYVGAARASAAH